MIFKHFLSWKIQNYSDVFKSNFDYYQHAVHKKLSWKNPLLDFQNHTAILHFPHLTRNQTQQEKMPPEILHKGILVLVNLYNILGI